MRSTELGKKSTLPTTTRIAKSSSKPASSFDDAFSSGSKSTVGPVDLRASGQRDGPFYELS